MNLPRFVIHTHTQISNRGRYVVFLLVCWEAVFILSGNRIGDELKLMEVTKYF